MRSYSYRDSHGKYKTVWPSLTASSSNGHPYTREDGLYIETEVNDGIMMNVIIIQFSVNLV